MGAGQSVRIGKVTAVYPKRHSVRVLFDDTGQTSDELPVLVSSSAGVKFYCLPEVGAQVGCVMRDNGQESGFVLGDAYSLAMPPPFSEADVIGFRCGEAMATFDKRTKTFTIVGDIHIQGDVKIDGDVTASGISLVQHTHSGVESGGSSTGGPQ